MNSKITHKQGLNKLLKLVSAPISSKVLFAAIELDLFSGLETAHSADQVAASLGLHPENTAYLLDALTAMELLHKKEGRYCNSKLADAHLVKNAELYIGSMLGRKYNDVDIVNLVKKGPGEARIEKSHPASYARFADYARELKTAQKLIRTEETVEIISSLPEFSQFRRMLDLGGGPGVMAAEIVRQHTTLECDIFDIPEVVKVAEETIAEYQLQKRIRTIAGNYITDQLEGGYDVILASGTLNFAGQELDRVINNIYHALNDQGVFVSISEGLRQEETQPEAMVIHWLPSRLQGHDFALLQDEVSTAALSAGFTSVYKRTVDMGVMELDVDIIRKKQ
jgi:predicted TPR repeat methyltransferase